MAIPSHYGTPTTGNANNVSSLTLGSHVVGTASDRLLHIGFGVRAPGGDTGSGIDFNTSEALTLGKRETISAYITEAWTLKGPTETTADVVITLTGSVSRINAGASNYQDVNQTTPVEVTAGSSVDPGTAFSTPITTLSVNSLLVDTAGHRQNEDSTPGTGQTERWDEQSVGGTSRNAVASSDEDAATIQAYTQTYSWATSTAGCHVVLALKEVVVAGPSLPPLLGRHLKLPEPHLLARL